MASLTTLVDDGGRGVSPATAPSSVRGIRDLFGATLDEPGLTAAVQAVEVVIEEYFRGVGVTDGPAGILSSGNWPAVRRAMERGVPAAVLERSLWQAHLGLLDGLLERATRGDDMSSLGQLTAVATDKLTAYTVTCCAAVARVYTAPVPEGKDQRQLLIRILADGDIQDAEVEQVLGLRISDHHWATVLWPAAGSDLEVEDIVRFALTLNRAVGGSVPLIAVNHGSEVWMWTSWPRPPKHDVIAAACSRPSPPDGLRIGSGPIGTGVAGFRRSLLGARATRQILGLAKTNPQWCDYAEILPMSLFSTDREQVRWFLREVLGELGRDKPWYATLRETLRLYLARGRSRQQVASAMYINRNTVAYRVQKASQLLGRPIDEDSFEVRLALELARTALPGRRP